MVQKQKYVIKTDLFFIVFNIIDIKYYMILYVLKILHYDKLAIDIDKK